MGEVKDTIKGSGPKKKPKSKAGASTKNLVEQFDELRDEISRLTAIKDDDTQTEGKDAKAENVRKAAMLRAVHTLMTAAQTLLEDY